MFKKDGIKIVGIYKITNPSERIYIGQSNNIKIRFNYYKRLQCKFQKRLYNSFVKYGVKNHIFEILEECSENTLNERERYWQEFYNVLCQSKGLNCYLTKTDIKKQEKSDESKENFKKSQKEKWIKNPELRKNAKNRMLGKKRNKEFSNKMSIIASIKFSKKIINTETGEIFNNIKEASKTVPHSYTMVCLMLKGKRVKNKTNLKYYE